MCVCGGGGEGCLVGRECVLHRDADMKKGDRQRFQVPKHSVLLSWEWASRSKDAVSTGHAQKFRPMDLSSSEALCTETRWVRL